MTDRELMQQSQPEQEPVAWVNPSWLNPETRTWESESFAPKPIKGWIPLYTAPRQWQGLTDEEIDLLEELYAPPVHPDFVNDADHCTELIRHVEAKLKEKNT